MAPAPAADLLSAADWPSQPQTAPFVRTELFVGSERPALPEVSDAEFKEFLDEEITPRFPDRGAKERRRGVRQAHAAGGLPRAQGRNV